MRWRIIEGDARARLADMPDCSVQTCVTSPPYFGLRDYGHEGQIGLEATPDGYVAALVEVFREVRRVLRHDGTLWLNLGDSYNGYMANQRGTSLSGHNQHSRPVFSSGHGRRTPELKAKDLLGIPWMVAFALRADGWYLRSDIIWSKPNPMPESVTDRPTKAHEYLFLLSKSARYYYDADAIREANDHPDRTGTNPRLAISTQPGNTFQGRDGRTIDSNPEGRNKRSVWTVATQPYPGAHFATFPPKLIEPCILAGSSDRACGECGAPWRRVVERTPMVVRPTEKRAGWQATDDHARTQVGGTMLEPPASRTVGWEPTCKHEDDSGASVVLDPFAGAGTTGLVGLRHQRSFVGIELNPEYASMCRRRLGDPDALDRWEQEQRNAALEAGEAVQLGLLDGLTA